MKCPTCGWGCQSLYTLDERHTFTEEDEYSEVWDWVWCSVCDKPVQITEDQTSPTQQQV